MVVRMTIMNTAMTSSITSEPMTRPANFSFARSISSRHFCITTVELMDSITPRNTEFMTDIPSAMPKPYPTKSTPAILTSADTMAVLPMSAIL